MANEPESFEITELEDDDLDSVSGGALDETNNCTNNCYQGNCAASCGGQQ